ncbi:nitroreductase-like oxidoreductase [Athelia psychrophila]|uniref:Nitroreductase-like oxidoreductase n=1 Tax=Athelia psychrophila TaxID=1759441 RepID=A0A166MAU5_9AGAM|nr:nitroreductase-like oxidoreductase [Fibularhizoctonia sp. CBS 109695]
MSTTFMNALIARRGYYALSKSSPIPKAQIKSILETAVKHIPSSFNMQSARVVLLTGAASQNLWATIRTEFLATLGENASAIEMHKAKFDGYASGFGTVLFFEDQATVDKMAAAFPGLAGEFPVWSQNSAGMLQFAVWTALKAEGLGASLQHHGTPCSLCIDVSWFVD